jgi:hypothetical protein
MGHPPSIVFCRPLHYVSPDRFVFEVDEREPLPQAIGHEVGFLLFLDTPRRGKLAGVTHALKEHKIGGPPRAQRSGNLPTRQDLKQLATLLQTQPLDGQRVTLALEIAAACQKLYLAPPRGRLLYPPNSVGMVRTVNELGFQTESHRRARVGCSPRPRRNLACCSIVLSTTNSGCRCRRCNFAA